MSGQAAVLQTESAAVQSLTTSTQLETIPTSGRAYQTALALMPGVAQPNYDQSGGSNNPTRAMAITVNGQPPSNTVVRLDGVTQINQFFQQIQAYSPSLEAIETVSVVTNSFDADQGMAGGASVNVQVKSGTNTLAGSLFEHAHRLPDEGEEFLPAGRRSQRDRQRARVRRHGRRPHRARTRSSSSPASNEPASGPTPGNALVELRRQRPSQPSDDGDARRQLRRHRHGSLRSAHRRRQRHRARAVRVCELSGSPRPPIRDSTRATTFRQTASTRSRRTCSASWWRRRCRDFTNNYFATNSYDTDYNKYDGKITWTPSARVNINGRLGYADSYEDSAPELPSVDQRHQPDLPGAHLGLHGPQPLAGDHLHADADDGRGRRVRLYAHRHAGPAAHG